MQVALEELVDLKGVWSELTQICEQIGELKEKLWVSVAPRKVKIKDYVLLDMQILFLILSSGVMRALSVVYFSIWMGN